MSLRIIIADDHPLVRVGARAMIVSSGVGAIVAEATSVSELMQALAMHACDVLVTDFSMPNDVQADGFPMISQIRRLYPDLPILLLSAATNTAVLRSAAAAGVLGILDKAGSLNDLPTAIQAVHRGSVYVSATHERRAAELGGAPTQSLLVQHLSTKEAEVLRLIASGMTVTDIADKVNRQVSTISRQKRDAMRKLGLKSDAELFEFIRSSGFT